MKQLNLALGKSPNAVLLQGRRCDGIVLCTTCFKKGMTTVSTREINLNRVVFLW